MSSLLESCFLASGRDWPLDFTSGFEFSLCVSSHMNVNMSFCRLAENECVFLAYSVVRAFVCQ